MDTSETYIKMRRKAIPDLGKGTPIDSPCTAMADDVWVDSRGNWYYATQYQAFQLERQDQLQEIYNSFDDYAPLSSIELAGLFNAWLETFTKKEPYSWLNDPTDIRGWVQPSMERLCLAFVMGKYSKVWDGEDWVKA